RSFQYVDPLVDGILRLLSVDYVEPVNIGNPTEFTVLQLANLVREIAGDSCPIVHRPLPADDPKRRCPDISLARSLLSWAPKGHLADGLTRTIDAMRVELG